MPGSTALARIQNRAMLHHSVERAEDIKYLPWVEVSRLLACVDGTSFRAKRDHLLLRTLAEAGPRRGEVVLLTKDSLDPSHRQLLIPTEKRHRLKERKVGRPRRADLPIRRVDVRPEYVIEFAQYLMDHRSVLGESQNRLFPITPDMVRKIVRTYAVKAGVDRPDEGLVVHPHTLRHSYAVHAVLEGVPLPILQRWMGHASILSTMVYATLAQSEGRPFFDRMRWEPTPVEIVRP